MSFSTQVLSAISPKHLLKHPFYQAWNAGELSRDTLKLYSQQYFKHVSAFPRYLSATHSNGEDIQSRQVLLENLNDEEMGSENHPELWMRFAEAFGNDRNCVPTEKALKKTQNLVDTFMNLSKSSFAEGLGALYAYESQVPEVAQTKIEGLKKFYNFKDDDAGLKFFEVHLEADKYHREAVEKLLNNLSPTDKEKAMAAARSASEALWSFLDGILENQKLAS